LNPFQGGATILGRFRLKSFGSYSIGQSMPTLSFVVND
jgi:hypothetical protein